MFLICSFFKVRQFMSGIKNYVVKSGDSTMQDLIEGERVHLPTDRCLNLDAILEAVLHQVVLGELLVSAWNDEVNVA